ELGFRSQSLLVAGLHIVDVAPNDLVDGILGEGTSYHERRGGRDETLLFDGTFRALRDRRIDRRGSRGRRRTATDHEYEPEWNQRSHGIGVLGGGGGRCKVMGTEIAESEGGGCVAIGALRSAPISPRAK